MKTVIMAKHSKKIVIHVLTNLTAELGICTFYLYFVNTYNGTTEMSLEHTQTYLILLTYRKQESSLCHIRLGGRRRKMFKFDKGRGFPVQVGVILGLGLSICWLGNMKVNHRLQIL